MSPAASETHGRVKPYQSQNLRPGLERVLFQHGTQGTRGSAPRRTTPQARKPSPNAKSKTRKHTPCSVHTAHTSHRDLRVRVPPRVPCGCLCDRTVDGRRCPVPKCHCPSLRRIYHLSTTTSTLQSTLLSLLFLCVESIRERGCGTCVGGSLTKLSYPRPSPRLFSFSIFSTP